jgi:hypothetical protein
MHFDILKLHIFQALMRYTFRPFDEPPKSWEATSLKKFRLLLWKNYKIQIRHKIQTVTEILLPLMFTTVLVIVRNIVPSTHVGQATVYKPLILEGSPPGVIQTKWCAPNEYIYNHRIFMN